MLSLSLLGCASNKVEEAPKVDPVEAMLADGVQRIAAAYEKLAVISSATSNHRLTAQSYNYSEADLPEEWLQELTLIEDYHGDIGSFVQMISVMAGLGSPRIDTPPRGKPVIVTVQKGTRKLISYLADVGYQSQDKALVQPDIGLNTIIVSF